MGKPILFVLMTPANHGQRNQCPDFDFDCLCMSFLDALSCYEGCSGGKCPHNLNGKCEGMDKAEGFCPILTDYHGN